MINRKLVVLVALFLLFAAAVFAQSSPAELTLDAPELAGKIIAFSAAVAAVLQGIKKWIPALSGWPARGISIALAVVGAYAAADPGHVLSIDFFLTALGTALGANGIHSFFRSRS